MFDCTGQINLCSWSYIIWLKWYSQISHSLNCFLFCIIFVSLFVSGRGHWIHCLPLIRLRGGGVDSVNWENKMTGPPAFTLEKSEKPRSMRWINFMGMGGGGTWSQSGNPVTGRFNHVLQLYTAVFDFVRIDHKGELAKHRQTDFQADGAQQVNSTVILYPFFFFFLIDIIPAYNSFRCIYVSSEWETSRIGELGPGEGVLIKIQLSC